MGVRLCMAQSNDSQWDSEVSELLSSFKWSSDTVITDKVNRHGDSGRPDAVEGSKQDAGLFKNWGLYLKNNPHFNSIDN